MAGVRLVPLASPPSARLTLVCFPHAGGGISNFASWAGRLPADVALRGVLLPGRESLLTEPPLEDMEELLDELVPLLGALAAQTPLVLFGHSLGAFVAYEATHRLRGAGVLRLVVSGCRAPHLPDPFPKLASSPEEDLIAALAELDGTPPEVLACAELVTLALPALRADLALFERYHCAARAPLAVSITAYGGRADPRVGEQEVRLWRRHTAAGFTWQMFEGDHFFAYSQTEAVLSALGGELASCLMWVA
jgi:surfactin synthase thioesterase subunit